MRIHPAIAALRSDRAPQRHAQNSMEAALDSWRSDAGLSAAQAEFEAFGNGAALEDCPTLEAMFTGQGQAETLVDALVSHFCAAIAANPLAHPPFRNGFDGRTATLLLARSGRAQLMLQSREPGRFDFQCATYNDALRYDATLAGRAQATILRVHGPHEQVRFAAEQIVLEPGVRLSFDCNSEALLAEMVETRLVTLRLVQLAEKPQPAREYCRQSGGLLQQSAGTLATSRREMMVALLGRMGRADAAPVMAQMALRESDQSLRWQALRNCLTLDTATGFAALSTIAAHAPDPLSDPASALRTQLLEAHPQLSVLESA